MDDMAFTEGKHLAVPQLFSKILATSDNLYHTCTLKARFF